MSKIETVLRKAALVNFLPPDMMDSSIDLSRARELFADYVDTVEIENHAFCNRVCWFCPNRFLDRRSALNRMKSSVFRKIITDLAEINYSGALIWSRYHEVLADVCVFERMAAARKALPKAALVVISNGDYMDRTTMARLESAGIDRLMLDLYLPDGKETDQNAIKDGLRKFKRRTGLKLRHSRGLSFGLENPGLKATLDVAQYTPEEISTRGGLLDLPKRRTYARRAVCLAPVRHLVIDYNGKAMLCCQTRSDAQEHASAIIGDLSEFGYSIFHYYRDLAKARRNLLAPGCKSGVCTSCDVRDDGPDRLARRPVLTDLCRLIPGAEPMGARLWKKTMRRQFSQRRRRSELSAGSFP